MSSDFLQIIVKFWLNPGFCKILTFFGLYMVPQISVWMTKKHPWGSVEIFKIFKNLQHFYISRALLGVPNFDLEGWKRL